MEDLKTHFIQRYNFLNIKEPNECLKLSYQYNLIKVNLYFDFFNNDIANLFLVLKLDDIYYYTSLNIDILTKTNPYLIDIPKNILAKMTVDKQLNNFYNKMREHILNGKFEKNSYDDIYFKKGIITIKDKIKNPFLHHLRKANMTSNHFKLLKEHLNIDIDVLKAIQNTGFTIVTTTNPYKRKTLRVILNTINIKI